MHPLKNRKRAMGRWIIGDGNGRGKDCRELKNLWRGLTLDKGEEEQGSGSERMSKGVERRL